jgi:hypothetical protein
MATYKLEVQKEFGRFQHRIVPSGRAADASWSPPVGDRDALLADLGKSLAEIDFASGDTVVFRSIAYSNPAELANTVKFSAF